MKKRSFSSRSFSLFLLTLSIDGVFLFAKFTSPIMSEMELLLGKLQGTNALYNSERIIHNRR